MNKVSVEILEAEKWWERTRYRLINPLAIGIYSAPSGFVTDGATVPRVLSILGAVLVVFGKSSESWCCVLTGLLLMLGVVWFPPVGRYMKAAIIHDHLLALHPNNRHLADRAFIDVMELLKIHRWRRSLMFMLVWCWSEIVMQKNKIKFFFRDLL